MSDHLLLRRLLQRASPAPAPTSRRPVTAVGSTALPVRGSAGGPAEWGGVGTGGGVDRGGLGGAVVDDGGGVSVGGVVGGAVVGGVVDGGGWVVVVVLGGRGSVTFTVWVRPAPMAVKHSPVARPQPAGAFSSDQQ